MCTLAKSGPKYKSSLVASSEWSCNIASSQYFNQRQPWKRHSDSHRIDNVSGPTSRLSLRIVTGQFSNIWWPHRVHFARRTVSPQMHLLGVYCVWQLEMGDDDESNPLLIDNDSEANELGEFSLVHWAATVGQINERCLNRRGGDAQDDS